MKMNGNGRILFVLALCSFWVGLDSIITVPLLPLMAKDGGIASHLGALFVTAYALVYMISAPLFGVIADRWGRKKMILLGLFVLAAGTVLTGLGNGFVSLLAFRAITGLGAGMLEPSVLAYVGDRFPYAQRGRAVGIVMGALVGSTLFGVPAGTFLAEWLSWRWAFGVIGGLALLTMLIVQLALPEGEARVKQKGEITPSPLFLAQLGSALTSRTVCFSLLATFLWFGGLQGMFANIGLFYSSRFQLDVGQIGLVLMAAGFGSVIGTVTGGKLSDAVGKRVVLGTAAIVSAAGVLGLSLVEHSVGLAVGLHVVWSAAFGFGHVALTAITSELSPEHRGTVLSLNSSAMYAGMMSATAVSSLLLSQGGFAGVGLLCACAAVLVVPVSRKLREGGRAAHVLAGSGTEDKAELGTAD
ncbi:MFS transporter [Paenibacillus turpanensis]|uniref:MFS transporter n=1 Tax=Paenibacillus turpanensis TaxID=2689078 RepID=UPI00140A2192|nr:MFS transporter [Paenibacillus turpanensis]